MEHHTKTMAHKWERHYPTTKTTISVAMVVIGACFIVSLVIAWPQKFSSDVFNSRLLYHTIIDIEDYFTCSPDYQKFVIDEPSQEDRLVSMYLFNVTNTRDTIEQGYKPTVEEVGPFGYRKHTYKYDISFETSDSLNVTFKEYTLLKEVTDLFSCQRMFFKLDRSFAQTFSNPCENDRCICKSHDAVLTAVNPLYLKLFWSETPHTILSYYSQVVMKTVLDSMENGFVKAARAHLLPNAMEEIMMFRQQMQSGTLLKEIFSNLYVNYSMSEVSSKILNGDVSFPKLTTCGLEKFGLSTCTLSFGERFNFLRELAINKHNLNASTFHLPSSIIPIIDPTSEISIVNTDFGIPMWAALCKFQGIVEFNGGIGYTMITSEEMKIAYDRFIRTLAAYDANIDPKDVTQEQYLASEVIINGISFHLAYYYINGQKAKLLELTYDEYNTQYTPVTCSPMGIKCIWQWGFMMKYYGATLNLGPKLSFSLVDTGSKVNTNPNNVLFPGNSARYYNVFTFCHRYGNSMNYIQSDSECPATDISYTYDDSLIFQPAGLWGAEFGINGVNKTFLRWSFSRQSKSVKEQYFSVACNVSTLLHKVYREETPFHDEYVIRYINKFKDPALNHTFVVGQWEDLGYAQWGGGYITQAIVGVRSMYQVVRDGMWIFGRKDYWNKLYEFSTWAARNGFPNAYLTNVKDSKLLMYTLASDDAAGIKFRAHMIYRATTWIGNGNDFINFVGKVGEVAFIDEATNADFNCDSESTSKACELLATTIYSSADNCNIVQGLYEKCAAASFAGNIWLTNCNLFETSMTANLAGIQCDQSYVFGRAHPFGKLLGNIVYIMLSTLTVDLYLKVGLWCPQANGCKYEWGGIFTTAPARRIFFEGYSEPSVLSYLNLKHKADGIHFLCRNNPYDNCGIESLKCDDQGIVMYLPNGQSKILTYGLTPNDEFFAPKFHMRLSGELIWPNSIDDKLAIKATNIIENTFERIIEVINPHWAAFPSWNTNDVEFNKFIQCQRRMYSGDNGFFNSCFDTLQTGRRDFMDAMQITHFRGNDTVYHYPDEDTKAEMKVNGSTAAGKQYFGMYLWEGFLSYPYLFNFLNVGPKYFTKGEAIVFDKFHGLRLKLSQREMQYDFEKNIPAIIPFRENYPGAEVTTNRSLFYTQQSEKRLSLQLRRFTETDESWDLLKALGEPRDSYGMPYKIPLGMTSLQKLTQQPLYLGTAHCFGNQEWGGLEFGHVLGYNPDRFSHQSFVDYDPVMGTSLRSALRQQLHLRIERSPLHANIISSQKRCIAPTKAFSGSMGFGCYSYLPLTWNEDAKLINVDDFFHNHDHFYTRPDRALLLSIIGTVIGSVAIIAGSCLYISEAYHRRKFKSRIYVD